MSSGPALEFPADYPLKVVGRPAVGFRARVHAIVLRHAPQLPAGRLRGRLSAPQVEALFAELRSCAGVLMLL